MKNWVNVLIILSVVAVLCFFGLNFTGNVVWEPTTTVNNCSNETTEALWDEIFRVTSNEIVIFNSSWPESCGAKAYWVDESSKIYILEYYYSLRNNTIVSLENGGSWRQNSTLNIKAVYLNVSLDVVSKIESSTSYDDVDYDVDDLEDVSNNSITDTSAAKSMFDGLFDVPGLGSFQEIVYEGLSFYSFVEEGDYPIKEDLTASVVKKEDWAVFRYNIRKATPVIEPVFVGAIPDYEFDQNSSWNAAFNVSDYFNVSDGVDVSFSSVGVNNTNGAWINYSIIEDLVSFKPATGFLGVREFVLMADSPIGADVYSNVFNVTIGVHNDAPTLRRNFENLGVSRVGGEDVFLEVYFKDNDGDNLTYGVIGGDNLNISFDDDIMTVRLENDFDDVIKIRVYADDGTDRTRSNYFYIYELGNSTSAAFVEALAINESVDNLNGTNVSIDGDVSPGGDGNISSNSTEEKGEGLGNWILWVFIIVIVLFFVLLIIWFFFLKKRGSLPVSQKVSGVSPVNSYIKSLNLLKK